MKIISDLSNYKIKDKDNDSVLYLNAQTNLHFHKFLTKKLSTTVVILLFNFVDRIPVLLNLSLKKTSNEPEQFFSPILFPELVLNPQTQKMSLSSRAGVPRL